MKLQDRLNGFSKLGNILSDYISKKSSGSITNKIISAIEKAELNNPWFTYKNIIFTFNHIANQLQYKNLNKWAKKYPDLEKKLKIKTIGIVAAGNIPLVAFHDFLSVLISGNKVQIKLSSKDQILFHLIIDLLININSDFEKYIEIKENNLSNFDAIIATGGNNTARYFEYYFNKYPNIIRQNRNSIAILDGKETKSDLNKLADDIYLYFGLGCRNVSKIFLPQNYDITKLLDEFNHYNYLINNSKYSNNYTYNKSVFLMNSIKHYDNGFSLFKEDTGFSSPISVIYFEFYENSHNLYSLIEKNKLVIQCMVSKTNIFNNSIKFGKTQNPDLWDYADDIDTLKFLLSLT